MVDTSSTSAPTPTVSLSQIDQTSRGEGQGLETASPLHGSQMDGADIRHQSLEVSLLELLHPYLRGS
jgi:hypothetical protein